jgi:hypothetical protein
MGELLFIGIKIGYQRAESAGGHTGIKTHGAARQISQRREDVTPANACENSTAEADEAPDEDRLVQAHGPEPKSPVSPDWATRLFSNLATLMGILLVEGT